MKQMDKTPIMVLTTVTPEMASEWLNATAAWVKDHPEDANRPVSDGKVTQIAAQISGGCWRRTNKAIALGAHSVIRDGTGRCRAIVRAGIPVESWVEIDETTTSPRDNPVDSVQQNRPDWWTQRRDRDCWEVAKMICALALKRSGTSVHYNCDVPVSTVCSVCDRVVSVGMSQTKKSKLSQVAIRTGVVLAWHKATQDQKLSVLEQYRSMILGRTDAMSPSVSSFAMQVLGACVDGKDMKREEMLVRAIKAFSPNVTVKRVQVRDIAREVERACADARSFISGVSLS